MASFQYFTWFVGWTGAIENRKYQLLKIKISCYTVTLLESWLVSSLQNWKKNMLQMFAIDALKFD